jgi:hypothetical protein
VDVQEKVETLVSYIESLLTLLIVVSAPNANKVTTAVKLLRIVAYATGENLSCKTHAVYALDCTQSKKFRG